MLEKRDRRLIGGGSIHMVTDEHSTWQLPQLPAGSSCVLTMSSEKHSAAWTDLACGFLCEDETHVNFDPQAFFSDYIFTGELLSFAFGKTPWLTDWQK